MPKHDDIPDTRAGALGGGNLGFNRIGDGGHRAGYSGEDAAHLYEPGGPSDPYEESDEVLGVMEPDEFYLRESYGTS